MGTNAGEILLMKIITLMIVYVALTVFTFGHAFVNFPDTEEHWFAGQRYTMHNGSGTKIFASMVCGISWPLYWSVELQR